MQAISRLIFNLLAQRQRVILPGLGTLYTELLPATIDQAGILSVPQTRVLFSTVEESGETLPEIITTRSGIPLKEIRPQYNRWVANLRKASSDGELGIEGVVLLLRQTDGSYWAEPAKELDRILNPAEQKTWRLPAVQAPKGKPGKTEKASPNRTKERSDSRYKRRAMRLAVSGALLVVLVYAGYFAFTRGWFDGKPSESVPVSTSPAPAPAEPIPVIHSDTLPGTDTAVEPTDSLPSSSQPGTIPESHTGDVYHIIAGVFSNRENAERYVREQNFEVSRTTIIPTTGGRFMVSIGRFPEKGQADAEMKRLQASMPQAWVYKRRK